MQPPEVRSVWEAAQDPAFLHGLALVSACSEAGPATRADTETLEKAAVAGGQERARGTPEISDRMCCTTCSQAFDSREEQTEHYRLDWHRFNLKQRLRGRRALAAEEFEEKTRAGDVSSISGSDSEGSGSSQESDPPPGSSHQSHPLGTRSARVLLRNSQGQLLSAYRCVLSTKGSGEQQAELVASLRSLGPGTCWVILMTGGGHFAGAVFRGPEVLAHKTFHRYTVRARRGTAQGLRDAQGQASMPRSAGASLRRYNETALLKDVQDLLASWAQHLQGAQRIFLRAPRGSRALLFGGRTPPLRKDDPRVCNIPFSTRRATLREVLRVHAALATLQVFGKDTAPADLAGSPRKGWRKEPRGPVEEPQQSAGSTTGADPWLLWGPSPDPSCLPEASGQEEEEESQAGELETVEVTLGTLQLREFEVMPKRSRKRRRKRDKVGRGARAEGPGGHNQPEGSVPQPGAEPAVDPQEGPIPWGAGAPWDQLRDALFTACRTGAVGALQHLLGVVQSGAPPASSEPHGQQGEGPAPGLLSLLSAPVDGEGSTLLHVAAAAGQGAAVRLLMEAGADPALRDRRERPPYCVSADKPTRAAFRKYMGEHPAQYDYGRAQVPGPLTAEMEAKRLEKQRAQKAQRKQRAQELREQQQRLVQEQEEKRRFAALPDREKRALAAERRLAAQLPETSVTLANPRRCWQCGESLLGRIPFHYLDCSFCSTACLQAHRRGRPGPP